MNMKRIVYLTIAAGMLGLAACSGDATGGAGPACTNASVPAAGSSCVVAGSYTVRSTPRCPVGCSSGHTLKGVTVTAVGTDVGFSFSGVNDQGDQTVLSGKCTLANCECVSPDGRKTVFTDTGWVSDSITTTTVSSKDAGQGGTCAGAAEVLWEATRN